ncbi:hypothetical protein HPG69_002776 [Diceros bicornis minor]|uniref:Uncharacterized protein n=1 Tax=Diceros bicornis minor TaxID=77932 RepID=A0A7J7EVG0_DICBM|nr:hypothetical protein HPG69_002776 [Diceros bicornis minor]
MVGHLHLQGMEESLKEKSREGLLDSPDSGLPPSPSPSPPFYSLAPGILDARAGGAGASSEPPGPGEARAAGGSTGPFVDHELRVDARERQGHLEDSC